VHRSISSRDLTIPNTI